MALWLLCNDKYIINTDNITYINWENKSDGRNEFTIGYTSGKEQTFTTTSSKEELVEEVKKLFNPKGETEDANSEKLPKPEPAWRTILGE